MKKFIYRVLLLLLAFNFFVFSSIPVLAEESLGSAPTETNQTQSLTGPQSPTGPREPTGPQEPTGPREVNQTNVATGPNSTNENSAASEQTTTVDTGTETNTANQADISLDTGNNSVQANTVAGNVGTGSIDGAVTLVNVSDSQFAEGSTVGSQILNPTGGDIILAPSKDSSSLNNSVTGPESVNLNSAEKTNVVKVFSTDETNMANEIIIDANTGKNDISNNTSIGDITTGDINLGLNLINLAGINNPNLQLTVDVWNILGDVTGDIYVPATTNAVTGPDSTNLASSTQSDNLEVSVDNTSEANNNLAIQTDTGNNQIGSNTIVGDITTGDTTIKSSTTNLLNLAAIPIIYILNITGFWDGTLPKGVDPSRVIVNQLNSTTGPASTNINASDNTNQIELNNRNNTQVNNNVTVNATTGGNNISSNSVVGNLTTGAINLTTNTLNALNSFGDSIEHFTIGIINIFGDWRSKPAENPTRARTKTYTSNNNVLIEEGTSPTEDDKLDTKAGVENSPADFSQNQEQNFTFHTKKTRVAGANTQISDQTPSDPLDSAYGDIFSPGLVNSKNFANLAWPISQIILSAAVLAIGLKEMFKVFKQIQAKANHIQSKSEL